MWLWEFGRGKQRSRTVTEEEMQLKIILEHSRREVGKEGSAEALKN